MKRGIIGVGLLAVLLALPVLTGCQKEPEGDGDVAEALTGDPSTVLATVGDQEILLADVDRIVGLWRTRGMPGIDEMPEGELQRKALDNLIDQKVIFAASKEAGMLPTEAQVDEVTTALRSRFPSEEMFQQVLAEQGTTEEQWRSGIAQDMAVRAYLVNVIPDTLQVTPEMARAYYEANPDLFETGERVRARHILLRSPPIDETAPPDEQERQRRVKEQARRKADSLLVAVRAGANFEEIAREVSECPSSVKGGDLGEFGRGDMVPPFEEAVFALELGEVSDVVETSFGFHIIRLDERIPPGKVPYDAQLEARLAEQIRAERRTETVREWVAQLRAAASIEQKL